MHTLKANRFIQRAFADLFLREFPTLSKENSFNIIVAVGEALQNIVRHGYQFREEAEVQISFFEKHDELIIEITDQTPPCDPTLFLATKRTPSQAGGMGISIIRQLTKYFWIESLDKGHRTKLVFEIGNVIK